MTSLEIETAPGLASESGNSKYSSPTTLPEPKRHRNGMTSQARWKEANPQAVWAHQALRSALNRGLVIQEPCEVCGALVAEAHHPDYDRPMDVRWFCRRHHKQEHRRLKCEVSG
ncbi:hypothetical protein [Mesorhizobium sp.]|uniref:hypothetical protein n=1 Tax=Mesorhizobium sp. TaxID=1871066 RepID=UPI002580D56B|nr:hypothetical protein [Mesorhizobium sp.]